MPDIDSRPVALPRVPDPPSRPPLPILATIVPIVGAVVLWLVTGSPFTLLFAVLGPLVAIASLVDGVRSGRRQRRRARREMLRARDDAERQIAARHDAERDLRTRRHPDVAALLARSADVWRPVPDRDDHLVVGAGEQPSALRVTGGDDDDPLRRAAETLPDAPWPVPLRDGVCVVGPTVLARAVARALVLQLCLARSPADVALVGAPADEGDWADLLPHRDVHAPLTAAMVGPGEAAGDADVIVAAVPAGSPTPMRCGAVITVTSPDEARLEWGTATVPLRVEGVSRAQAAQIAEMLAQRARALAPAAPPENAGGLAALIAKGRTGAAERSLTAAFAHAAGAPAVVDLVADGPHAVVTGITGTGKSEMLISWVASLCARYSTRQVSFLLADFKGGTAFDALRSLPHVTGVITDLDAGGAERAIRSLRAELRWREARLAALRRHPPPA